jgi:hypothetical protein
VIHLVLLPFSQSVFRDEIFGQVCLQLMFGCQSKVSIVFDAMFK